MPNATLRQARRGTRDAGQKTRTQILESATALFVARGWADVSLGEIAAAADCFPSQITYYFRSKEALFVEVACRELLRLGDRAGAAADACTTPDAYLETLARVVAPAPALALMIEAMTIATRRPDLAEAVARAFDRLHDAGAHGFAGQQRARGWASTDAMAGAKRFWTLALGVRLRIAGTGGDIDDGPAELLQVLAREPITPA